MKRPMGVTVLAVLAIIGGVLQLLAGLVLLGITGLISIPGLTAATTALYAGAGFVVVLCGDTCTTCALTVVLVAEKVTVAVCPTVTFAASASAMFEVTPI